MLAEDGAEDADDDVVDPVGGGLDDGVEQAEHDSDVLGAVGGKEESNTGGLDDVAESGLNLVVQTTFSGDSLSLLDQSDELRLGSDVVLVLR